MKRMLEHLTWYAGLACCVTAIALSSRTAMANGPQGSAPAPSNCPDPFPCGPNNCPSTVPACGTPPLAPNCTCF